MKIIGQEHEADVRFRRDHGESEELSLVSRANFLNEFRQVRFCLALFLVRKKRPLTLLDLEEKVNHMPSLVGDHGVGIGLFG